MSKVYCKTSELPAKPVLNFREISKNGGGGGVGLNDALTVFRLFSSMVGVANIFEVPTKLMKCKTHSDNIFNLLANSSALIKLLVSSQIQEKDCAKVASEIKAKCDALKEGRRYMLETSIPLEDRTTHVGPAISTCREVLSLFQDRKYTLWEVPIPASELLINFAAIFTENALICSSIIPSHKDKLYESVKELESTLSVYKDHCISSRVSKLTFQARTADQWEHGVHYGDWLRDDDSLLGFSRKGWGLSSDLNLRLRDTWPSLKKNGELRGWEWHDKLGWEGFSIGPSDENIKTALIKGVEYRAQIRKVYGAIFDEAIKGVGVAAQNLKT